MHASWCYATRDPCSHLQARFSKQRKKNGVFLIVAQRAKLLF